MLRSNQEDWFPCRLRRRARPFPTIHFAPGQCLWLQAAVPASLILVQSEAPVSFRFQIPIKIDRANTAPLLRNLNFHHVRPALESILSKAILMELLDSTVPNKLRLVGSIGCISITQPVRNRTAILRKIHFLMSGGSISGAVRVVLANEGPSGLHGLRGLHGQTFLRGRWLLPSNLSAIGHRGTQERILIATKQPGALNPDPLPLPRERGSTEIAAVPGCARNSTSLWGRLALGGACA